MNNDHLLLCLKIVKAQVYALDIYSRNHQRSAFPGHNRKTCPCTTTISHFASILVRNYQTICGNVRYMSNLFKGGQLRSQVSSNIVCQVAAQTRPLLSFNESK